MTEGGGRFERIRKRLDIPLCGTMDRRTVFSNGMPGRRDLSATGRVCGYGVPASAGRRGERVPLDASPPDGGHPAGRRNPRLRESVGLRRLARVGGDFRRRHGRTAPELRRPDRKRDGHSAFPDGAVFVARAGTHGQRGRTPPRGRLVFIFPKFIRGRTLLGDSFRFSIPSFKTWKRRLRACPGS